MKADGGPHLYCECIPNDCPANILVHSIIQNYLALALALVQVLVLIIYLALALVETIALILDLAQALALILALAICHISILNILVTMFQLYKILPFGLFI